MVATTRTPKRHHMLGDGDGFLSNARKFDTVLQSLHMLGAMMATDFSRRWRRIYARCCLLASIYNYRVRHIADGDVGGCDPIKANTHSAFKANTPVGLSLPLTLHAPSDPTCPERGQVRQRCPRPPNEFSQCHCSLSIGELSAGFLLLSDDGDVFPVCSFSNVFLLFDEGPFAHSGSDGLHDDRP